MFVAMRGRERCYWHLVCKGRRCCYIPYNARDSPSAKNDLVPSGSGSDMGALVRSIQNLFQPHEPEDDWSVT